MAIPIALGAINAGIGVENFVAKELVDKNYRINTLIHIKNWTNGVLECPEVTIAGGTVEIPPTIIAPGQRGVMVARKTAYTPTGTYGTVSWLLKVETRRIVVMWDAPFNFDFHDNCLAVGLTRKGIKNHADRWYKQMYYENPNEVLGFSKQKYKGEIRTVMYEDEGIEILGTMSTTHHAEAKITIRPLDSSKYAENIKKCFS